MTVRFIVSNGKSIIRWEQGRIVDAWYVGGVVYYLDLDKLGNEPKVHGILIEYLDIFIDGSYFLASFVEENLNSYAFTQEYKKYALQLAISFQEENDGVFAGGGDTLFSDHVKEYRNFLLFSPDGYHKAKCGKERYWATYIDGYIYLYWFETDGSLHSDRKQLSLFYCIHDANGRVFSEKDWEDLFLSVPFNDYAFRWALELMGNYYGASVVIPVLSPVENCADCPELLVRDGALIFRRNATDYPKECLVFKDSVYDGYEAFSLKQPFNFVVKPKVSFTHWYQTLVRVLRGDYNPEHLAFLSS